MILNMWTPPTVSRRVIDGLATVALLAHGLMVGWVKEPLGRVPDGYHVVDDVGEGGAERAEGVPCSIVLAVTLPPVGSVTWVFERTPRRTTLPPVDVAPPRLGHDHRAAWLGADTTHQTHQ